MPQIHSLLGLVERIVDHIEDGTLRAGFEEPIQRGSATGFACILPSERDPESVLLMVRLSIMKVPDDSEACFRRLMELNHQFEGRAAFSIGDDDIVYLTSGRPVEDLDPGEVIDLILWASEKADDYDDILLEEFGREYEL